MKTSRSGGTAIGLTLVVAALIAHDFLVAGEATPAPLPSEAFRKEVIQFLKGLECLPETPRDWESLVKIGAPSLPLIEAYIQAPAADLRRAIGPLAEIGKADPEALGEARKLLAKVRDHPRASSDVREEARRALGEPPPPTPPVGLQELAKNASSPDTKKRGEARATLLEITLNDKDEKRRGDALGALLDCGWPETKEEEQAADANREALGKALAARGWPADGKELEEFFGNRARWPLLRAAFQVAPEKRVEYITGKIGDRAAKDDALRGIVFREFPRFFVLGGWRQPVAKAAFDCLDGLKWEPQSREDLPLLIAVGGRQPFDKVKPLIKRTENPALVAAACGALGKIAAKADLLRYRAEDELLDVAIAKETVPPVCDAAAAALVDDLKWSPEKAKHVDKLVAEGSNPFPLMDTLLNLKQDEQPRRLAALNALDEMVKKIPARESEVRPRLLRAAADEDLGVARCALTLLWRRLDWPRKGEHWEELVAQKQAERILGGLLNLLDDADAATRVRAAGELAKAASGPGKEAKRAYAIGQLLKLAPNEGTARGRDVRMAVVKALGDLSWPQGDAEWQTLRTTEHPWAVSALLRLIAYDLADRGEATEKAKDEPDDAPAQGEATRKVPDAAKEKARGGAMAIARECLDNLLVRARKSSDRLALVDGLEIKGYIELVDQWQMVEKVLAQDVNLAQPQFVTARTCCENGEGDLFKTLSLVKAPYWPSVGPRNKWRELLDREQGASFAPFRESKYHAETAEKWKIELGKLSKEMEAWRAMCEQALATEDVKTRSGIVRGFLDLEQNRSSFYVRHAPDWIEFLIPSKGGGAP